jgi:hypothetical protein
MARQLENVKNGRHIECTTYFRASAGDPPKEAITATTDTTAIWTKGGDGEDHRALGAGAASASTEAR